MNLEGAMTQYSTTPDQPDIRPAYKHMLAGIVLWLLVVASLAIF